MNVRFWVRVQLVTATLLVVYRQEFHRPSFTIPFFPRKRESVMCQMTLPLGRVDRFVVSLGC